MTIAAVFGRRGWFYSNSCRHTEPRFAIDKLQACVQTRWDCFHRCVNDTKQSLAKACRGVFVQAQLYSSYLWSLSYRPFGSGACLEHKARLLEVMLSRETYATCVPFQQHWKSIRDDLGLPASKMSGAHCRIAKPLFQRVFYQKMPGGSPGTRLANGIYPNTNSQSGACLPFWQSKIWPLPRLKPREVVAIKHRCVENSAA